jgi:tetratricopeptide (TPR) repeat protein
MAKSEEIPTPEVHSTESAAGDPMVWIRKNQRLVTIALIAVVVIVGGVWLTVVTERRKEAAGQQALNVARAAFDAYNLPTAAAAFQEIIRAFSGTRAADEAVLNLNQVRLINGQNELAIVALRDYLGTGPGDIYEVPAAALLAAALENVNRPEEAAEAFMRAADGARVEYLKAEYLLSAGRAFLAAEADDQAAEAFQTILEDYSETPSRSEAAIRLSEIEPGVYSDAPEGL